MKKVVIYTGDLCIHCDWAIELLNRKNIEFTEYNVAKDITKKNLVYPTVLSAIILALLNNYFSL